MRKIVLLIFLLTFMTLNASFSYSFSNRYFPGKDYLLVFLTEKGRNISLLVIDKKLKQVNKKDEIVVDNFIDDVKYIEDKENHLIHLQYFKDKSFCIKTFDEQGKTVSFQEFPFSGKIAIFDDFSYMTIQQVTMKNNIWGTMPASDHSKSLPFYKINSFTYYNTKGDSCWSTQITTDPYIRDSSTRYSWDEGYVVKKNNDFYISYSYNHEKKMQKINDIGIIEKDYIVENETIPVDRLVIESHKVPFINMPKANYLIYDSLNIAKRIEVSYNDLKLNYLCSIAEDSSMFFLESPESGSFSRRCYMASINESQDLFQTVTIQHIYDYFEIKEEFIKHPEQFSFYYGYIIRKRNQFWLTYDFLKKQNAFIFSNKLLYAYNDIDGFYITRKDNNKTIRYTKNRIYYNPNY